MSLSSSTISSVRRVLILSKARLKFAFQKQAFHLFNDPTNPICMLQHIHTVLILSRHISDTSQVTINVAHTF